MRKIINPFSTPMNQCFGCSRHNPVGLKLDFFEDGEEIISEWQPRSDLQGYINVLHGGIQATLLDEIASWTVCVKAETAGVTSSMNIRYIKPVYLNHGPLKLKARLVKLEEKQVLLHTELWDARKQLCTEAEVVYYLFPDHIARSKYHYPGKKAFFLPAGHGVGKPGSRVNKGLRE